ncbi:MAG: cyclic nucleotide-binding domain-containing protein [Alphaproteobacteria bacterium]|nr:cyclic nucleotide-binding domain-containing protein [Alphaproteobacteria bacterium]
MEKNKNKNKRIILERRFYTKGTVIIEEGEQAFCAYLVQSGSVLVYKKKSDGKIAEIATLGPGQICGEMALIQDETSRRTASVKALSDCNLIVITRTAFEDKLENCDPTIKAIVEMLVDRIKNMTTNAAGP